MSFFYAGIDRVCGRIVKKNRKKKLFIITVLGRPLYLNDDPRRSWDGNLYSREQTPIRVLTMHVDRVTSHAKATQDRRRVEKRTSAE